MHAVGIADIHSHVTPGVKVEVAVEAVVVVNRGIAGGQRIIQIDPPVLGRSAASDAFGDYAAEHLLRAPQRYEIERSTER